MTVSESLPLHPIMACFARGIDLQKVDLNDPVEGTSVSFQEISYVLETLKDVQCVIASPESLQTEVGIHFYKRAES